MIDNFNTILFILSILWRFYPGQIIFVSGTFEDLSTLDKICQFFTNRSHLLSVGNDRKFVQINSFFASAESALLSTLGTENYNIYNIIYNLFLVHSKISMPLQKTLNL